MKNSKPRIIKSFDKLDDELKKKVKEVYPYGFSDNLVSFSHPDGRIISALPFETDDASYLLRFSVKDSKKKKDKTARKPKVKTDEEHKVNDDSLPIEEINDGFMDAY